MMKLFTILALNNFKSQLLFLGTGIAIIILLQSHWMIFLKRVKYLRIDGANKKRSQAKLIFYKCQGKVEYFICI